MAGKTVACWIAMVIGFIGMFGGLWDIIVNMDATTGTIILVISLVLLCVGGYVYVAT